MYRFDNAAMPHLLPCTYICTAPGHLAPAAMLRQCQVQLPMRGHEPLINCNASPLWQADCAWLVDGPFVRKAFGQNHTFWASP